MKDLQKTFNQLIKVSIKHIKSKLPMRNQMTYSHLARNYKRADSFTQNLQTEIKKIKYPLLAIEPAQSLQSKITQFKNQKLQIQMKQTFFKDNKLNCYRKIRGDGNCFFRALAYSYLSSCKNLSKVQQTFQQLENIQLTVCSLQSVPKQFKPFYNDSILKQILRSNWLIDVKHLELSFKTNNKRILCRLFRKYPYLDFIVILYFRSLCLQGLQKYKEELKEFMKGNEDQEIRTYGQESEGLILDICSRYLKAAIDVYQVRKQELKHYRYKNEKMLRDSFCMSLLYYQNHYDIIEGIPEQDLQDEQNDTKIVEEEYYSKINEDMIDGNCIECGKEDYIYADNYLCDNCFEISKNQLLNTAKSDKWIRGVCRDCGNKNLKVLEMISLCKDCLDRQSSIIQQDLKKTKNKPTYYCPKCQSPLNSKQQCQRCSRFQIGRCLQCERLMQIQNQTKLCARCKEIQQSVLRRKEKESSDKKGLGSDYKSPINNYFYPNYHNTQMIKEKCRNCGQYKESSLHQMKCINKLTTAKIEPSIKQKNFVDQTYHQSKVQNSERKCRGCKNHRIGECLVGGYCRTCRHYFNGSSGKVEELVSQTKQPGSQMSSESNVCEKCGRTFYLHKLSDGICSNCLNQASHKF